MANTVFFDAILNKLRWKDDGSSPPPTPVTTIYTGDATFTGNRVGTLTGKTLSLNGSNTSYFQNDPGKAITITGGSLSLKVDGTGTAFTFDSSSPVFDVAFNRVGLMNISGGANNLAFIFDDDLQTITFSTVSSLMMNGAQGVTETLAAAIAGGRHVINGIIVP